jgi:hypothetical protein
MGGGDTDLWVARAKLNFKFGTYLGHRICDRKARALWAFLLMEPCWNWREAAVIPATIARILIPMAAILEMELPRSAA